VPDQAQCLDCFAFFAAVLPNLGEHGLAAAGTVPVPLISHQHWLFCNNLRIFQEHIEKNMTNTHLSEVAFADLDLAAPVLEGVANAGFTHCTPIQAQTLPLAIGGRDVAGQAQTGTGKSAAFLLAMFQRLVTKPNPERKDTDPAALILAPTRELAIQIYKDAVNLGEHLDLKLRLVYGGTDYEKQRQSLTEGVDIIIGTPGRLIDYFKQGLFTLKSIEVLILDEADRMFDLGFIKDIRYLMRRLPARERRQNMLFSATLSHRVLELAYEHMNEPELVRIEPDKVTADRVKQVIYYPSNRDKMPLLIKLLKQMDPHRTMLFVNTRRAADMVTRTLEANGFSSRAISGDVPQKKRQRMLQEFKDGGLQILVGTDVASRGLHIDDVSHVFNYDLPQDAEDYVHRIGRTARAGTEGDAISFGCEDYAMGLPQIEDYIGYQIPVEQYSPDDLPEITRPPRPPRKKKPGGGGRGRPGGGGRRSGRSSGGGSSDSSANAKSGGSGGRSRRRRRRGGGSSGGGGNNGGGNGSAT
jgi:ATP-dependent RNA helicase RhlB